MKRNFFLMTALLCVLVNLLSAQSKSSSVSKTSLPEWVEMIDNPNTNYYVAVKAFDDYWKDKVKPKGDSQMMRDMQEGKNDQALEDSLAQLSTEQKAAYELIRYHYKRFKNWRNEVRPFIQEDGRILTQQERVDIWKKQQEEIRQSNK